MKAVILAGGLGTRISEESHLRPKPMIEIGHKPIIWHIMKSFSAYGVDEFIICCGYKGYVIKEYFANYFLHNSDVTFDMKKNEMAVHHKHSEPWKVTLVDTGDSTETGGRLKRVAEYLNEDPFLFTYGDGVSDINIKNLISFHQQKKTLATITAVQPPGRFGHLSLKDDMITAFDEKPAGDGTWINGGFFVLSPKVLELIDGDRCVWEDRPLKQLAETGQLASFKHKGFWHPMDTLRDRNNLERLWETNNAPWKVW